MIKHRLLVAVFASIAVSGWSGDTEIIVESYGDGLNSQAFTTEGRWLDSEAKSKAPGLKATKTKFNDANDDAGSAKFTPEIPVAGQYEVFITYPVQGNAEGVKYKVAASGQVKEEVLTQYGRQEGSKPPANEWFSLGVHNFEAGTTGYVEVSDPLTGAKPHAADNARVYADAVKFVPVGFTLPAEYVNKGGASTTPAPTPITLAAATPAAGSAAPAAMPGLTAVAGAPNTAPTLPALPGSTVPTPARSASPDPAGLPELPPPPTPASGAGLPALPAGTPAAAAMPTLPGAGATPIPTPDLPSLAPVAPTPRHNLPTPSDTPVPVVPGLAGGPLSNLPPLPTAGGPGLPTGPASPAPITNLPTLPPAPAVTGAAPAPALTPQPAAATPAVASQSITQYNPSGLQWGYDYGAGLKSARDQNKKVMVFFTATGNNVAQKYETEYFQHPSVREALNNYVLVKVDFPRNTRLGYSLGIFGAGMIVVTDSLGTVTARIDQLPGTPVDLVRLMSAAKLARPAAESDSSTTGTADAAAGAVSADDASASATVAAAEATTVPEIGTLPGALPLPRADVPPAPAAPGAPALPPLPPAPPAM